MTPIGKSEGDQLAALYARISDDKMGQEAGVKRQLADGREIARRLGLSTTREFVDNDISATNAKHRPEYERLLTAIEQGLIYIVIIYHLSRLWRNRRERAAGIEFFKRHSVRLIMVKGPEIDFSTAYGRAMAGLLGEFDSMEVEVKSERQVSEMEQAVQEGRPPTGRRAFGYARTGGDQVPEEAAMVAEAYRLVLAGASLSSIAAWLNKAGFRTTIGRPWGHNSVRSVLLNERNAGLREYKGELYAGTWEPIVPEETWRAAREILADPERRTNHVGSARRWLLTNLAHCGVCAANEIDSLMLCSYREDARRVYRCKRSPGHLTRNAEPIDDFVGKVVVERLSRPDASDLLVDEDAPDFAALRTEALTLRQRQEDIAAAFGEGELTRAQFNIANTKVRERLAEVEAVMGHAHRAPILTDLVAAEDVAETWRDLVLERKRAVVDTLVKVTILPAGPGRRVFNPTTVRIEWK
ncbi:recombinase family protein [Microbispora siamensis]